MAAVCRYSAARGILLPRNHLLGWPAKAAKREALYVRVSTDHQSVENQVGELKEVAERRGWSVVGVYRDAGISGAKGRDQRPGLDAMLNDASRQVRRGDGVDH